MIGGFGPSRMQVASALRGRPRGTGIPVQGPATTPVMAGGGGGDMPPAPSMGGGGGGGWKQMGLGQAFTSLLDAVGSAKGGQALPRSAGQFIIGPEARQHIPNYQPGQVQAVFKMPPKRR